MASALIALLTVILLLLWGQYRALRERAERLAQECDRLQTHSLEQEQSYRELHIQWSEAHAQVLAQQESHHAWRQMVQENQMQLREVMDHTMNVALEHHIARWDQRSKEQLGDILLPLREHLKSFEGRVDQLQHESRERLIRLSSEIEQVMRSGLALSQETMNLTRALKGDKQFQGSWGEMILESILTHSGLIEGEHFHTQKHYRDETGAKRPDVIISLPDQGVVIIDAKVSLVDYDRFLRDEDPAHLRAMIKAFYHHIDTLAARGYHHYQGSLHSVLMFVPIESAYALVLTHDQDLYRYALDRHIMIVYPASLMMSLRTIHLYWQHANADVMVEKVMEEAGKLYDKVHGFVESFEKIEYQLATLTTTYAKAKTQLYEGQGNVVRRIENLRALGAKVTKKGII